MTWIGEMMLMVVDVGAELNGVIDVQRSGEELLMSV